MPSGASPCHTRSIAPQGPQPAIPGTLLLRSLTPFITGAVLLRSHPPCILGALLLRSNTPFILGALLLRVLHPLLHAPLSMMYCSVLYIIHFLETLFLLWFCILCICTQGLFDLKLPAFHPTPVKPWLQKNQQMQRESQRQKQNNGQGERGNQSPRMLRNQIKKHELLLKIRSPVLIIVSTCA